MVRYGFMIITLLTISFNINYFETRDYKDSAVQIGSKIHIVLSMVLLHLHFLCLPPNQKGHTFFGILTVNLIFFSAFTSSMPFEELATSKNL